MCKRRRDSRSVFAFGAASLLVACTPDATLSPSPPPHFLADVVQMENIFQSADPTGTLATYSTTGSFDQSNPFFQSLGTNGRSCGSCHIQADAFGLSAATAQAIFARTGGTDPLFAPVDGANCPTVAAGDVPAGHSLLLNNGLFRIALPVPNTAQFTIAVVHDPYGCALQGPPGAQTVSVYRRPLPTTNLNFLSAVMSDGRETLSPLTSASTFSANLQADLAHQAMDATLGHAQATSAPTASQLSAIVNFELALFTAQRVDSAAGVLNAQGANGGPEALASQQYYPGINDPLGGNPTGAAFNDAAFTLYAPWQSLKSHNPYTAAREAVARGEAIFDTHALTITDVKGLNDALGVAVINGTCTTCHDSPNIGNHSRPVPLDLGTSHALADESDPQVVSALSQLAAPDLPIFQLTCTTGSLAGTVVYTSDPGRALITGLCSDIGRVKGPILRGLPARAPYFHNGAAANLSQVVAFYNQRFQMGLTPQQQADLAAYLRTL